MVTKFQNGLAQARSAYLLAAADDPVEWQPWGPAAFARAIAENKPILLSIGATWCRWCRVMDRESYQDGALARLINDHFVAVRVDGDERPDIDARYQAAVSAISGQGGWPLTVFLTPDGRPFFGGTYFPREERYGQPGFQRVLITMAASFRDSRPDVEESANSVMDAIEHSESFTGQPGDLQDPKAGLTLVNRLVQAALQLFDPAHGGFGSQPKFPHPAAITSLLDASGRREMFATDARNVALTTLEKMSRGGILDQLAGGFHRYSLDERWIVPRFEKTAYDNAALLTAYTHAFQQTAHKQFAQTALDVMRWMTTCLSDPERGGFYAAQDADAVGEAAGSYYTWSQAEIAAILTEEERGLAALYFDVGAVGDLRHDPERNVLFLPMSLVEAAVQSGLEPVHAVETLRAATAKLHSARALRPAPHVDRAVYTGWNGLCISAYVLAGRVFGRPDAVAFARKSLDRVLAAACSSGRVLHVAAYGTETADAGVQGLLDDYVFLGMACLDVWEATGEPAYFDVADEVAGTLLEHFADQENGGFFDVDPRAADISGALRARRKPVQDAPTPGGNPSAAQLLLRLHALTGRPEYHEFARRTLECFAGVAEHLGLNGATFGLAVGSLSRTPLQVTVVGPDELADELEAVALQGYAVNRSVIRLRSGVAQSLPSILAATLAQVAGDVSTSCAVLCAGEVCHTPVSEPSVLSELLKNIR